MSAPAAHARSSHAVVEADHLRFAYDREPILDDVSLRVHPEEFVALVGPNGSGKSTLLKILLGLLQPGAGRALLFGEDPRHLEEPWRLGYVPQRPALARDLTATVREVVATGRLARVGWWRRLRTEDREAVEHAIESVALESLAERRVSELSIGQQQRAFIARSLASEPDLLVLDEPIAGVDAESQQRFRESLAHLISHHASAVLLVSHELSTVAEDLDRVIVLKRRVIFDGTPRELVESGVSLGVHGEDLPLWLERLG